MSQVSRYVAQTELPTSATEAFAYHERPGALDRLIPPWESVQVESSDGSLAVGSRVILKTKIMGLPLRWVAEHTGYDPPNRFADRQVSGPFASWEHEHRFSSDAGGGGCTLRDSIDYRLPMGLLGRVLGGGVARKAIESMFAFRHRITRDDLMLAEQTTTQPMKIAISGSSGLVGTAFSAMVKLFGHETIRLVRSTTDDLSDVAIWSDGQSADRLSGIDAVVHLAGKSIAEGPWTKDRKQEFWDSRVERTRHLCERLAGLDRKPRVLVCASATGYYGDCGESEVTEQSAAADDFLGELSQAWEQACQPARDAGIRVVHARFGIVLSVKGGALVKMLGPAKLMGGSLGSGKQWWSWIALDDAVGALYHAITHQEVRGAVNLVAPDPIRNRDFAATLGKVLGRPALVPAPAFALRMMLGEMADALLLRSVRVKPRVLEQTGYRFRFTDLADCLEYSLGKTRLPSTE